MRFELNEDTAVLIAVGTATILVLGMVAYTAMQPKPTEYFFALYLLGPSRMATGYPKEVRRGDPVNLYIGVYNSMGRAEWVRVMVKIGANATSIPGDNGPSSAPVVKTYERILLSNQTWEFPASISIDVPAGNNYNLMFELWYLDEQSSGYVFGGQWTQIWLNVTS